MFKSHWIKSNHSGLRKNKVNTYGAPVLRLIIVLEFKSKNVYNLHDHSMYIIFLWYSNIQCYSMVFLVILWYSMVFYGILWYSMVFYGILWYTMVFYGILWYSMVFYGILWYSVVFCGILWYSMVVNGPPEIIKMYN